MTMRWLKIATKETNTKRTADNSKGKTHKTNKRNKNTKQKNKQKKAVSEYEKKTSDSDA